MRDFARRILRYRSRCSRKLEFVLPQPLSIAAHAFLQGDVRAPGEIARGGGDLEARLHRAARPHTVGETEAGRGQDAPHHLGDFALSRDPAVGHVIDPPGDPLSVVSGDEGACNVVHVHALFREAAIIRQHALPPRQRVAQEQPGQIAGAPARSIDIADAERHRIEPVLARIGPHHQLGGGLAGTIDVARGERRALVHGIDARGRRPIGRDRGAIDEAATAEATRTLEQRERSTDVDLGHQRRLAGCNHRSRDCTAMDDPGDTIHQHRFDRRAVEQIDLLDRELQRLRRRPVDRTDPPTRGDQPFHDRAAQQARSAGHQDVWIGFHAAPPRKMHSAASRVYSGLLRGAVAIRATKREGMEMAKGLATGLLALGMMLGIGTAGATPLRIALSQDPHALDPAVGITYVGRVVFASICDKLVDIDAKLNYVPQLATSWSWSADNLTLTMKLRPGVKFQDGETFDAAAVKANIERYQTAPFSKRKAELKSVQSVEVVDPMTVVFHLSKPDASLLGILSDRAGMMVAPDDAAKAGDKFSDHPVCAGPFKFSSRVAQEKIVLDKFDGYWNKDAIHVDQIVFTPVPDSSVQLANLKSGGFDIIGLAPTDLPSIRGDKSLKLVQSPSILYYTISINTNNGPQAKN